MIGTLLGNRYEILELVGKGGMANVYKAKCTMLNRFVAIKVLKDEFSQDQDFIKKFNIESQASAGLSHTNIVSVYDVGTQENIHYIVMEYVEGVTLKKYLDDNGALPVDEAIDFSIQIVSALNHAHRKGIVHRDIKPQNIIVTKDKQLKVTDFGIARAVSSYTMKIDDTAIGTAHYCSPEQATGRYTDEKSDLYSLGIVMYEMLTGKLPFESDSSVSVAIKHIQEEPVKPREIMPTIPEDVEAVVLKAMKKDQSERFKTASEMLIELNYINNGVKIHREKQDISDQLDSKFETKVIDIKGVKKAQTQKVTKPEKKEVPKEDKVAVWAAIASSVVIVAILCFTMVSFMFPSILPWNAEKTADNIAPYLVGLKYEQAVKKYKKIEIVEGEPEYSTLYDEGIIISQTPDRDTEMEEPYKIEVVVSKGAKKVKIPRLINLDYREAELMLEDEDILYTTQFESSDTVPEDVVMEVNPKAGTTVIAGADMVTLIVSSGVEKKEVKVPDVLGYSREEAEKKLEKAGLTSKIKREDSSEPEGTVIKQSVDEGEMVEEKTAITITISNGNGKVDDNEPEDEQKPPVTVKPTTKELTVALPTDRETATVKVTVNDITVYEKKHNTSEGSVSVPVRGTGKATVAYYIDGVKSGERTIQF